MRDGNYFWNSGMFVFSLKTIITEFEKHFPQALQFFDKDYTYFLQNFSKISAQAFDIAIMEKTTKAKVMPMILQWSDVGSWDSLREMKQKDENENVVMGDVVVGEVKKSLLWNTTTQRIIVDKLENVILIVSDDGVYTTTRGESQRVKGLL